MPGLILVLRISLVLVNEKPQSTSIRLPFTVMLPVATAPSLSNSANRLRTFTFLYFASATSALIRPIGNLPPFCWRILAVRGLEISNLKSALQAIFPKSGISIALPNSKESVRTVPKTYLFNSSSANWKLTLPTFVRRRPANCSFFHSTSKWP